MRRWLPNLLLLLALACSAWGATDRDEPTRIRRTVPSLCLAADRYRQSYVNSGGKDRKSALIALKLAADACRLDANSALPHIAMADTLLAMGRRDDAIQSARRAARLEPERPEVDALFNTLGIRLKAATSATSWLGRFGLPSPNAPDLMESERRLLQLAEDNPIPIAIALCIVLLIVLAFFWIVHRILRRLFGRKRRQPEAAN